MREFWLSIRRFRQYDWVLTMVVFVLIAVGLVSIYSVDLSQGDNLIYFPRQIISFLLGILVFFVAGGLHLSVYQQMSRFAYLFAFLLLVAVLIFGESIRGTQGWFQVAGFSFQPAEFAKVGLILILAFLVHRHGRRFDKPHFFIATGIVTAILSGLILLQPDLGSALVLVGIWFSVMIVVKVKKKYLFGS